MNSEDIENPWHIQSIYDFQYFNCPSCIFKNHSKQEFINHIYGIHPDYIYHLSNVKDNSLSDVVFPDDLIKEIKEEPFFEDSYEDPLEQQIKIENHVNSE